MCLGIYFYSSWNELNNEKKLTGHFFVLAYTWVAATNNIHWIFAACPINKREKILNCNQLLLKFPCQLPL